MKRLHNLIIFLALSAICGTAWGRGDIRLTQSLDSAYLLMGRTSDIRIELLSNGEPKGRMLLPATPPAVEIADSGVIETENLGNDRWQLRRTVKIQSFDSGLYVIPPVRYVIGGETIASRPLSLKVIPVAVDSLTDIHDYASTADAELRWFDRLPDWLIEYGWWILMILAIAGAGFYYWWSRLRRKPGDTAGIVSIKKEPPYDVAIKQLNHLREEKLCEMGQEKEFYTRLTEILRVYLQDRFHINAMEMTSTEIRHSLQANEETRLHRQYMDDILTMADFVKFAKVRPLPDDNVKAFKSAMQFVEDTRPQPDADVEQGNNATPSKTTQQ